MRRFLVIVVIIVGCLIHAGSTAHAAPREKVSDVPVIEGIVSAGEIGNDVIWFELSKFDQRFVLHRANINNGDAIFAALKASSGTNRSIQVFYDLNSGFIDKTTSKPTFTVIKLVYEGRTLIGEVVAKGVYLPTGAEANIAKGIALLDSFDYTGARAALDAALKTKLKKPLEILAIKTRGNVFNDEALTMYHPGPERDRRIFAALGDFRQWQSLAPDDPEAEYNIDFALTDLGAYQEALDRLLEMPKKWPSEIFWSHIRRGAIFRLLGDSALALDELYYIQAAGQGEGMAYHYHRGWTLDEMGRSDEAIHEYTEGLVSQPDYWSAYWRRACAYAEIGRLSDATADYNRARKLATTEVHHDTPAWQADMRQLLRMDAFLKAAVAKNTNRASPGLCESGWDWGNKWRPQSSLLPTNF